MPNYSDFWKYFHQAGAQAGASIKGFGAQTVNNPGVLHSVTINTGVASGVVTLYDGVSTSDPVIAIIAASLVSGGPTLLYDVRFTKGLFIVVANAVDVTVAYD